MAGSSLPVGIIGAGPAGATLARLLAAGGIRALLIDERGPHEKTCGGGVTLRGFGGHPVLDASRAECVEAREAVLESGGERARIELPEPVRIYPRLALNRLLFEAALERGAEFVQARATSVEPSGRGFRIGLAGRPPLEASFVAGADGAAGISRKLLGGGRGRARFVLAVGHHAERSGSGASLYLGFPRGLLGYVWIFPRPDHLSVGICSRDPRARAEGLRRALALWLRERGVEPRPLRGTDFSFPIPDFGSFEGPRAGGGWALLGDAGGFVDPITLEGISHAMRSAELLARAILVGRPEGFERAARADFAGELARAARIVRGFYAGDFTSRMVRAAARHPRVRAILGRLLAGLEPYRGLRRRVLWALFRSRAGAALRGGRGRRGAGSPAEEDHRIDY